MWRGNQNQLDVHLERCPYNILQPILKDMMLHKDLLTKQVDQYKNRIKKLETEVLEMDKKIIDLEELCNDYKEQIEQLKNQKQGNRVLYIIPQRFLFNTSHLFKNLIIYVQNSDNFLCKSKADLRLSINFSSEISLITP